MLKPKPRKPGIQKKIQQKHLPLRGVGESIEELKSYRSSRLGSSVVGAAAGAYWGVMGGAIWAGHSHNVATIIQKYFPQIMAASAVAGGGVGALAANRLIKKATKDVGKALASELQKNSELKKFLSNYKYVIIDRKGNLVGTSRPRILGIGRFRLETKKILAGEY